MSETVRTTTAKTKPDKPAEDTFVVSKSNGELVKSNGGGALTGYNEDAGAGFEGVGRDEFLIPMLRILQSNSPQVDESGGAYVEGAKPGQIANTSTGQLVDGKVGGVFVPTNRSHSYVEFIPREMGGGFVGVWAVDDPRLPVLRQRQGMFGKLMLENGNELTETFSLFGLFTPDGEEYPWKVVIACSSTQIRKYKMVITRLGTLIGVPPRYPIFAHKWRVKTQPEQNKKGKFFGWRFDLEGGKPATALMKPDDELYLEAREFYKQVEAGAAKANYEQSENEASEDLPF